jgi:hypothetical protein
VMAMPLMCGRAIRGNERNREGCLEQAVFRQALF